MKTRKRQQSAVDEEEPDLDTFTSYEDPKTIVLKEVDRYLSEARLRAKSEVSAGKFSDVTNTIYSTSKLETRKIFPPRNQFSADFSASTEDKR